MESSDAMGTMEECAAKKGRVNKNSAVFTLISPLFSKAFTSLLLFPTILEMFPISRAKSEKEREDTVFGYLDISVNWGFG